MLPTKFLDPSRYFIISIDEMRRLGFEPVDKAPGTQARGYLRIALKQVDAARDPYWQKN